MKKSPMKFVFHEQEVADVTFRAMVESGRVILHMVNSSGRESSVDLIGEAFALPCLCYSEKGWQRRGMPSGPPGWAVCHDSAREPQMFLGHLHSDDVGLLRHEFGLHSLESFGRQVAFKDSIAGQTLKQIMLHDPVLAALFRNADASLDNWAEQVVSEELANPRRPAAIGDRLHADRGRAPAEWQCSDVPAERPARQLAGLSLLGYRTGSVGARGRLLWWDS